MSGTLGVLVAGGRGTRLGLGIPKALVRLGGETLLARARARLAGACDTLVVVAPSAMALPVPNVERVADAIDDAGPLSALVAGLEARRFDRALALGVDYPGLDTPRLRALRDAHRGEPCLLPLPVGHAQPLAAVYAPGAVAELRRALDGGARALVPAVRALGGRELDDAALAALGLSAADFEDLDTKEELSAWERRA